MFKRTKDVLADTVLSYEYPYEDEGCLVFERYVIRGQLCIFIVEEYMDGVWEKKYIKRSVGGVLRSVVKLFQSFQQELGDYERLLSIWVFDREKKRSRDVYSNCKPVYALKEVNLPDILAELSVFLHVDEEEMQYSVEYDMSHAEIYCFPELQMFFGAYKREKTIGVPAIKMNKEGIWFTYDDDDDKPDWVLLPHDCGPIAHIFQRVATAKRSEYGEVILLQSKVGSCYSARSSADKEK